jgi:hypothetical protein
LGVEIHGRKSLGFSILRPVTSSCQDSKNQ